MKVSNQPLIDKVKSFLTEAINSDKEFKEKMPVVLQKEFCHYAMLQRKFKECTGVTINVFIIQLKINRIKKLISEQQYNLTEIAYKMNFTSVAHLSTIFKKEVGITPTEYSKYYTIKSTLKEISDKENSDLYYNQCVNSK